MLLLPTTLLRHVRREDTHYDWLIAPPAADPGSIPSSGRATAEVPRLWAGRITAPSTRWAVLGRFLLTPLPPHRTRYLTYQGPVSGGRGTVRRVDHGHAAPLLWTDARLVLNLRLHGFAGTVDLRRLSPTCWHVCVENPCITSL